MNEIEQKFYDAFIEEICEEIESGVVIGPYKVDFLYETNIVIEIDGHEAHKTKEQRDKDYKRERYLQREGYVVVRFTGTEVFLDAASCAKDVSAIHEVEFEKKYKAYKSGIDSANSPPIEQPAEPIKWRRCDRGKS